MIAQLQRGSRKWQELHEAIRPEIWLEKHVNEIVRSLKDEGVIDSDPVPKGRKFGAAANPLLWLVVKK